MIRLKKIIKATYAHAEVHFIVLAKEVWIHPGTILGTPDKIKPGENRRPHILQHLILSSNSAYSPAQHPVLFPPSVVVPVPPTTSVPPVVKSAQEKM